MVDGNRALLDRLFSAYQEKLQASLQLADVLDHPVGKGDESELSWEEMLRDYLPFRYQVMAKVTAVDYTGATSDEIDLLIVDRRYSPLVFSAASRRYIPAEAIYAALECKQSLDRSNLLYAAEKVSSVRGLQPTSGHGQSSRPSAAGPSTAPPPPRNHPAGRRIAVAGQLPELLDRHLEDRRDAGEKRAHRQWLPRYRQRHIPHRR